MPPSARPRPSSTSCPACGHLHPGAPPPRCGSCGAPIRELLEQQSAEQNEPGRFRFTWFLIALGVTALLTATILIGLPKLVPVFDFEGSAGMKLTIPIWFTSALLVGLMSPGRTFAEPATATALIAAPTVWFLIRSETVKTMPLFLYVLMAALGVLFAIVGAYMGERIQMGAPPREMS